MAIFVNELVPLRMYRGPFYYPIDLKDRIHNSVVLLMSPDFDSSINTINHPLANLNKTLFQGYYTERMVELIINNQLHEGSFLINNQPVSSQEVMMESVYGYEDKDDVSLHDESINLFNGTIREEYFYNDFVDSLLEDKETTRFGTYNYSQIFKRLLYDERMKSQTEIIKLYDQVKEKCNQIKYTYTKLSLYNKRNLFYDWSYYTNIFLKNNTSFKGDRGLDVFFALMDRFVSDTRFNSLGYKTKTIVIPIDEWNKKLPKDVSIIDYKQSLNPISLILRGLRINPSRFDKWKDYDILVLGNQGYFKFKFSDLSMNTYNRLLTLINNTSTGNYDNSIEVNYDSKQAIMNQLADKLLQGGIVVNNLTGGTKQFSKEELEQMGLLKDPNLTKDEDIKKAILVNKLDKAASKSTSTDDALESLNQENDEDEEQNVQELLIDLQNDDGVKMNKARKSRMEQTRKDLDKKQIGNKTVKELLDEFETNDDIPETDIPVDSIEESWQHIKYANFNKTYAEQMDADIVAMFVHFNKVTHPMNILDIKKENTSTSEDYVDTWTCKYEDAETGKRFNMILDIPRLINNRFMKLRGNEKTLIGQLILLPIIKTDEDTAQIVSNYNKIFIRRKSPGGATKTSPIINKLVKAINKYKGRQFKVSVGNNDKICSKYELPIEFIDIASLYSTITFKDGSYINFNMDELSKIPFDTSYFPEGSPERKAPTENLNLKYMGIYVKNGKRVPIINQAIDMHILEIFMEHDDDKGTFTSIYNQTAVAKRLMYSEASILNTKIPVIIVTAYAIGLQRVLDKVGIKYEIQEKRPSKQQNFVRFSDGYLVYTVDNSAQNLLMNGLMQCDTTEFSIKDMNSKEMYLSILDDFGGRIKADGLDNFYDLMMDPITAEICRILNIPDDYIGALLYANDLLVDNKFNRHSDITGNRIRTNEIIVGHLYQVLSKEFGTYRNMVKRNKTTATFTAKKSAVIDSILNHDQTSSDVSTLNPLLEAETASKITFKGLSGINSDRAFGLDKRSYDDSMLGVLGISTGFASTVGINRQTTIDAGVKNKRGFITPRKPKDLNTTNTFTIMEALSPLSINHDDPFRTAMAFTQTVQHQMLTKVAMPSLITTGAEEALPYLTSNKFSYKFPFKSGKVVEVTDDYMILEDDKTKEKRFVDLRVSIQKNSDGGFYLTTKLDPCVKKGQKLKENDIVAYDKQSYSAPIGKDKNSSNIAYNMGTLAKIAIMNTDLGYEDSCVVDNSISEALESKICVMKDVSLDKNTNVYNVVNIGDPIQEGDPLLIFQDAFEEKEANELLKNITDDNAEALSDIGRKRVRSKVTGIVRDIKVLRTVDIEKLSSSLQELVKKHNSKIEKLKSVMRKNNIDEEYTLQSTDKLPQEGKLKALEGVRIEFFIEVHDKFGIGDKLVFSQALKGVNSYIVPKGQEAFSEYRPEEHVNAFLTISGVMGRMVPSAFLQGYMNKFIIELTRQVQEELGIKPRMLQDILHSGVK